MKPLCHFDHILYRSPAPAEIYCYTPALLRLNSGRLIASFDLGGPGVKTLPGIKAENGDFGTCNQGKVYLSDDHGRSWRHAADFSMLHARPFAAGNTIYLIGHSGKLKICRSLDQGETWGPCTVLDADHDWHQSAGTVDYRHGKVYLTMEQVLPGIPWPGVAPVLLSAPVNADLTRRDCWQFSNPLLFSDLVQGPQTVGVPFFPTGDTVPDALNDKRYCGAPCWLESHVLRLYDPDHHFYDPSDRSVIILMRAHTGRTNLGAIAQGREAPDGSLQLLPLTTPAGAPLVYLPLPGGQMKFHIVYDPVSRYYWLVSSQATDSMTRPDRLPPDRYNLPDNERHRLQLHFSKNLFDWCFAGIITLGASPRESRHYAAMLIDGDDLHILCRSGDALARSAHNGNLITFHTVADFRQLIY